MIFRQKLAMKGRSHSGLGLSSHRRNETDRPANRLNNQRYPGKHFNVGLIKGTYFFRIVGQEIDLFDAKLLHWQCPGCKHWATVKPVFGVAGE